MYNFLSGKTIGDIDSIVNTLGNLLDNEPDFKHSLDKIVKNNSGMVSHRFNCEDGAVILEAVVTGHNPDNIHVRYNSGTKVLKVVDENVVPESSRPWYYSELNLEFKLPETTIDGSFSKHIENGVLFVTASYIEDKKEEAKDVEII